MTERIPSLDMAIHLNGLAYGMAQWLENFSDGKNKRPDHEIEQKRRDLAVLTQAATDYRASAERARQMKEAS